MNTSCCGVSPYNRTRHTISWQSREKKAWDMSNSHTDSSGHSLNFELLITLWNPEVTTASHQALQHDDILGEWRRLVNHRGARLFDHMAHGRAVHGVLEWLGGHWKWCVLIRMKGWSSQRRDGGSRWSFKRRNIIPQRAPAPTSTPTPTAAEN